MYVNTLTLSSLTSLVCAVLVEPSELEDDREPEPRLHELELAKVKVQ